ncbi:MAG: fumarylacetoacetate hydrolase family protein [Spirochaetaceae bacterium]|nr:fumarylacetoacetate hydrolase family protein [Spirochaetaceae bacterium]
MKLLRCLHKDRIWNGTLDAEDGQTFTVLQSGDQGTGITPKVMLRDAAPVLREDGSIQLGEPVGSVPLDQVRILAPCVPSKAVCIGLNYRDHARELGLPLPAAPVVFLKPSTSLLDPDGTIQYPDLSHRVDYEAELVVVIGRTARHVKPEAATAHILGYTCGNDVTARDLQPKDGQWTVAKSFDTFMPLGPWIATDLDPAHLEIRAIHNGRVVQHSNTFNLIFGVCDLVAYLSSIMTLLPGDVIMTGTPSGIGPMQRGDRIAIEIEGIGRLENTVG